MTPRAEEVWSYLIDRKPFGEAIRIDRNMIADLAFKNQTDIYRYINQLIRAGCIKRVSDNQYVVLARMGATLREKPARAIVERPAPKPAIKREKRVQAEFKATKLEAAARLAEIPRFDTRSLTGRIAGDPLPERSALAKRLVSA